MCHIYTSTRVKFSLSVAQLSRNMNDSSIRYSLADVAKCNGKNGARIWIVIYDYVYDVTDYMHQHPGGVDLIEEYAGRDATNGFDDFGHSSDAKKIMKEYLIGELEDRQFVDIKASMKQKDNKIQEKVKYISWLQDHTEDKKANRKKKQVSNGTKVKETDRRQRRSLLAVLCGKCTC